LYIIVLEECAVFIIRVEVYASVSEEHATSIQKTTTFASTTMKALHPTLEASVNRVIHSVYTMNVIGEEVQMQTEKSVVTLLYA
jgi:hypothetical protein